MKLFTPEIEQQLKEIFQVLTGKVTIALFTQEENCPSCGETKQYMEEIAALSDKIGFVEHKLPGSEALAKKYHIERTPTIVLLDYNGMDRGVRFSGIPAGHEINSFLSGLVETSGTESEVPEDLVKRIQAIQKPIKIKVFVTLSCPYCPGAVQKAHKLALMNENIEAEMIEAQSFPELSMKYNVSSVPKIVINDTYEILGDPPIDMLLSEIEKVNQ